MDIEPYIWRANYEIIVGLLTVQMVRTRNLHSSRVNCMYNIMLTRSEED